MLTFPSPRANLSATTETHRRITANEAAIAVGFSSYQSYLASDLWRRSPTRLAALRVAAGHCRICGDGPDARPAFKLHVHHNRYDRVGCERHGDLIVFCDLCHDDVTEIRRKRDSARRDPRLHRVAENPETQLTARCRVGVAQAMRQH